MRSHKRFSILDAPKDGVRFSSPVMDDLNQDYLQMKRDYSSMQGSLVSDVLHIAAGYNEPMLSLNYVLAHLDVLCSFAHASAMAPIPYTRPVITPRGDYGLHGDYVWAWRIRQASLRLPLPIVLALLSNLVLFLGEGDIILLGCRHPCMELQDNVSFIANDVSLLREKESFLIITGPNMGGKSTYMRQVR